jgi:hypothetical integral membrane protein (TIGR02206 family)
MLDHGNRAADIVAAMALMSATREFSAYGPSHWAVLAVFAIGSAALVWIGRRQSGSQARLLGRILGALTAAVYAAGLVHSLLPPTIAASVPLRLTDLATVTAAYSLWSRRHWAFALTYYWGLVLSTQALISPVLYAPDFPHYEFLGFWAVHLLVVWAAIYLTWGRGMRPRWRSYRFAVMMTAPLTLCTCATTPPTRVGRHIRDRSTAIESGSMPRVGLGRRSATSARNRSCFRTGLASQRAADRS